MEDQETLRNEVLTFLKNQFIMSVAVSDENKPSASVLLYYVDDDFTFYFATHTDSYKAKALKKNPLISMAIWKHNEMLVQCDGSVSEVSSENEKLGIIDKLANSTNKGDDFWPPLLRIKGSDYVVFKIKPTWLRKLDLVQDTMTQTDSPFSELKLS
jgi:nitroimidazol reductase NimA-like FMN-containing flavoprotein (pyridoxamine 5'-phosphate oxidase superfamily)